jgi:glycosyltransferase involved in cell wall biosynthesis
MISWEYLPNLQGGLGRHVSELLPALCKHQGLIVHLVTPRHSGGDPRQASGNLIVHRVEAPQPDPSDIFGDAQRANKLMEQYIETLWQEVGGFDLIHAHDWLVSFVALAMHRAHRTPLVVTFHATERGRNRGWLPNALSQQIHDAEIELARTATRIITVSDYMRNEVQSYFGVNADKISVIPNGVNTAAFDEQRARDNTVERQLYAQPDEQIVFHIGRMVHEKGAQVLVEAIPFVLNAFPQARFVIAGRGPLLEQLKQRAAALHIGHKVLFPGFVTDEEAVRMFCIADVAVFPSLYEPFGLVALEAMAARTPLVVASVGGLAEVTAHDKTAITVFPNDAGSLAWGISKVLREPETARQRADNAYRMVQEVYSWTVIAESTLAIYREVAPDV